MQAPPPARPPLPPSPSQAPSLHGPPSAHSEVSRRGRHHTVDQQCVWGVLFAGRRPGGECHIAGRRPSHCGRSALQLQLMAGLTLGPACLCQTAVRIPVSDPEGIPSPERLAIRAQTRVGFAAPAALSTRENCRASGGDAPEAVSLALAAGKPSVPKEFAASTSGHTRTGKDASGFDDWRKRTDNLAAAVLAAARVWREPGSPPAKPIDQVTGPRHRHYTGDTDQGQEQPRQARQGAWTGLIPYHVHDDQPHGQVHGDDFDNPVSDKEEMHDGMSDWELSQSVAVDLNLRPQTVAASAPADFTFSADGAGLCSAKVLVFISTVQGTFER